MFSVLNKSKQNESGLFKSFTAKTKRFLNQQGLIGNVVDELEKPSAQPIQNQYQIVNLPSKIGHPVADPTTSAFATVQKEDKNKVLKLDAVKAPLKEKKTQKKQSAVVPQKRKVAANAKGTKGTKEAKSVIKRSLKKNL